MYPCVTLVFMELFSWQRPKTCNHCRQLPSNFTSPSDAPVVVDQNRKVKNYRFFITRTDFSSPKWWIKIIRYLIASSILGS